ncbi:MAG: GtrA family protein [Clostridia bacterium]|nr:GtrA family protein [Clostridia bacterium]
MIDKIIGILRDKEKLKEIILYIFFGGCTTLINIATYYTATRGFGLKTTAATVIAWLLSVFFAYITNRIWVFHSENKGFRSVTKEIISFYAARLATGLLDLAIMYLCVDVFHLNDMAIKILSNVIVIILNYVLSKILIFVKSK